MKWDESCIGEEIPLLAEEGWTRHEENVPLPIRRGRGGAKRKPDAKRKRDSAQPQERAKLQWKFGERFRPEDFAELLLRLRPIGLALRATPAAPNRKGNIFFVARPPLLCEEGNLLSDAGFVRF